MSVRHAVRLGLAALLANAPTCLGVPVMLAHLSYMSEHTEPPLSRTPLWSLEDLCTKLHTTPATVHTWRKRGTAPKAYRIGRHLMFEEADVRAWLADRAAVAARERGDAGSQTGW